MGEGPTEVEVLLQDRVPFTGWTRRVACHVSRVVFLFFLVLRYNPGACLDFLSVQSWMMRPSSTAHRTRIWGSKRQKTKQNSVSCLFYQRNDLRSGRTRSIRAILRDVPFRMVCSILWCEVQVDDTERICFDSWRRQHTACSRIASRRLEFAGGCYEVTSGFVMDCSSILLGDVSVDFIVLRGVVDVELLLLNASAPSSLGGFLELWCCSPFLWEHDEGQGSPWRSSAGTVGQRCHCVW